MLRFPDWKLNLFCKETVQTGHSFLFIKCPVAFIVSSAYWYTFNIFFCWLLALFRFWSGNTTQYFKKSVNNCKQSFQIAKRKTMEHCSLILNLTSWLQRLTAVFGLGVLGPDSRITRNCTQVRVRERRIHVYFCRLIVSGKLSRSHPFSSSLTEFYW